MILLPFICIIAFLCCVITFLAWPKHHHTWGKWEDSQLIVRDSWTLRESTVSAQRRWCSTCNKKKIRKAK